jgi:uridine kinase
MVDPILKARIETLIAEKDFVLVAIDGPCASGKSTLAAELSKSMDCNVIHTDDFFLRPEQKTPDRLSEIGGNLDRERFFEEILLPLSQNLPFSYRPYDCQKGGFGREVAVPKKRLSVVEGSYSQHPFFGEVYDLRVFLKLDPKLQKERLAKRDPKKLSRFLNEWIPKENAYFHAFSIPEKADLIL